MTSSSQNETPEKIIFSPHNILSAYSMWPVVSMIPSAIQAVLSIAELIVGIVGTIFMGITCLVSSPFTSKCKLAENITLYSYVYCIDATKVAKEGAKFLTLSVFNLATAGLGLFVASSISYCMSKGRNTET